MPGNAAEVTAGHGFARRGPVRVSSIVVQDRGHASVLGEQGVAAEAEQVEVERLVGLPLVVALDLDGDRLRRLAGGEGKRAGFGDVVAVDCLGGVWPVGTCLPVRTPPAAFPSKYLTTVPRSIPYLWLVFSCLPDLGRKWL